MSRITNTIKTDNKVTTILVTKNDDPYYLKEIIIDTEDLPKLDKCYVKSNGYGWCNGRSICHIIMDHSSNLEVVIDHINGNKLDNRKSNLRKLTQHQNSTNKSKSKNNTGIVGIAKRKNGNYEYFRASCSDLTTIAVEARKYGKRAMMTKRYSKQFNINKLGEEEALKQAQSWLENKRKEFGYSPGS